MSNFFFIIGQIRALEAQLLTQNQLDRMIGANTPFDAFRVMTELEYADYIDESARPDNFEMIIDQGLLETKERLVKGTENHPSLTFLWTMADMNNLKQAVKLRFLQEKKNIEKFSPEEGFSLLGDLSHKEIEQIVFGGIFPERFPQNLQKEMLNLEDIWRDSARIESIEHQINAAYFTHLRDISRSLGDSFLKKLHSLLVDSQNIRSLGRSILIRQTPMSKNSFLSGGSLNWADEEGIKKSQDFLDFLRRVPYFIEVSILESLDTPEAQMLELENQLDKIYNNFLDEGQSGEINDIQVLISYFNRRIRNAKMLKCIMFSKFQGIPSEMIYEYLKTF